MLDSLDTNPISQDILYTDESLFTYSDVNEIEVIVHGGACVSVQSILSTKSGGATIAIRRPRENQEVSDTRRSLLQFQATVANYVGTHTNNIGIIDWGRNEKQWMAMKYCDGGTLADRIDDMTFIQSLWTAIGITKGIQHAHKKDVYHFDIKPENIVFLRKKNSWDTPKVIDWGAARVPKDLFTPVKYEDKKKVKPTARRQNGELIQLPPEREHYPPEFISSDMKKDCRTDIYGLSSVFYRLFTGTHKFSPVTLEDSGEKVFKRSYIIDENVNPKKPSSVSEVPESIDKILLKGLRNRKEERYQDIHQFIRDLINVYNEEADSHHPTVY